MLVPVRVEDGRPLSELPLQAIGVELGLLLTNARIATRALGLHQPQRLAVVSPQHVVHEALTTTVGHAGNFELAIASLIEWPAGFLQQQIDEEVSRLGL